MKFKIMILIICLLSINKILLAGLYYNDFIDNSRYKSEFNTSKQLLFNACNISATKMKNDPQIINSLPSIFIIDDLADRIIWNNYVNDEQGVNSFYNLEKGQSGFRAPKGICSFSDGDIFITDTINNRLVKLQWNNSSLMYIKEKKVNQIILFIDRLIFVLIDIKIYIV